MEDRRLLAQMVQLATDLAQVTPQTMQSATTLDVCFPVVAGIAAAERSLPIEQTTFGTGGQAKHENDSPESSDEGDFYWADGRKISLERRLDRVIAKLSAPGSGAQAAAFGVGPEEIVQLESLQGGQLSLFSVASDESAHRTLERMRQRSDVEWAAPTMLDKATGLGLYPTDEIIVSLAGGVEAEAFFDRAMFESYRPLGGTTNQFVASLAGGGGLEALQMANELESATETAWAMPNFITSYQQHATPDDPLYGNQWHLHNTGQWSLAGTSAKADADVDAPEAWETTFGSQDIVIAVIDDAVQTDHPDLPIFVNTGEIPGNGIDDDGNGYVDDVNGWDFSSDYDNDPNPEGSENHGTAVAGVAAAAGDNGTGVSGAAGNVRILPIRLGASSLPVSNIAESIYYAAGRTQDGTGTWRGADVMNMSLGLSEFSVITDAFNWAEANGRGGLGMPMLVSSGNSANANNRDSYVAVQTPDIDGFASTWSWVLTYETDASGTAGDDTVRLGQFLNGDGTLHRFDELTAPSGWSLDPFVGEAGWQIEDNVPRAYGTSRYQARADTIGADDAAYLMAPAMTVTGSSIPGIVAWLARSSEVDDIVGFKLFDWASETLHDLGSIGGANPSRTATVGYPANLSSTIAVGASTDWDYRSNYSQYGPTLDIVAPSNGGFAGITTTDRTGTNGYASGDYTSSFGGTSSASPLAAGVAALILSKNPTLTAADVRQILRDSADEIGGVTYTSGFNTYYGYGRINANAALAAAQSLVPAVTALSPSDDATGVAVDTDLVMTFDREIVKGTGDILIKRSSDDSTVEAIDVTGAAVTISGMKVTIDLANDLVGETGYYVQVPGTAFKDQSDAFFAGITDATTWNFTTADVTPPRVAGVKLASSDWEASFLAAVDSTQSLGYAIPDGADQLTTLPWTNLNRIYIQFSEDVGASLGTGDVSTIDDLELLGGNSLPAATLSYDDSTNTAMIEFDAVLTANVIDLNITASGVTDAAGNQLDGEWQNGSDAFASGDGAAGGDFSFRMNILPGDQNGDEVTNYDDLLANFALQGQQIGDGGYSIRADLDGEGTINFDDLMHSFSQQGNSLPIAPAPTSESEGAITLLVSDDEEDDEENAYEENVDAFFGSSLSDE